MTCNTTQTDFDTLSTSGHYDRIPVVREIPADFDTPLSAYLKLAHAPYSYLFESVEGGDTWGRYSIIGLPCAQRLEIRNHTAHTIDGEQTTREDLAQNPLDWINNHRFNQRRVPKLDDLPMAGGLVGYFGHETVHYIEPGKLGKSCGKHDPLDNPDILLLVSEELAIFDNQQHTISLIVHTAPGDWASAQTRLDAIEVTLHGAMPTLPTTQTGDVDTDARSYGMPQADYQAAVQKIKDDYIRAGDVMQVVPSQRISLPFQADSLRLYRALRQINPSPYMFHLHLGDLRVVGASPEILVRLQDDEITVRPIAGTRPRGQTPAEDQALEQDLLADEKERAEHLMLIDLGRNDVGRVSKTGQVHANERFVIERYSHVMHIVSNVIGQKQPAETPLSVLAATFPAGTLSGAPKIRALQIINEVEPVKRGVYGGAVGYISWQGNMDTAIAIRTAVIKNGQMHIQAGAGIVYDSVPENEWEETLNKGKVLLRAAQMVSEGAV